MLRRFEHEQLIKAESQKIPRIVIKMSRAQRIDPEVEQRQIPQDTVEKLCGKSAIRRREITRSQELPKDFVGKSFARAPFLQCDEREAA
jgi:hypothetical protein